MWGKCNSGASETLQQFSPRGLTVQVPDQLLEHQCICRGTRFPDPFTVQAFEKLASFGTSGSHLQHRDGKDSVQVDVCPAAQFRWQDVTAVHDGQRRFKAYRAQCLAQFLDGYLEVFDGLWRRVAVPQRRDDLRPAGGTMEQQEGQQFP